MRLRQPKPEGVGQKPLTPSISNAGPHALGTYMDFLSDFENTTQHRRHSDDDSSGTSPNMAAIFDTENPASPLAYDASQTALIMLDFQNLIIDACGNPGRAAVDKAAELRHWALEQKMMVLHSIVDVNTEVLPHVKSAARIQGFLDVVKKDPTKADEPAEVAFDRKEKEYIVLKPLSYVSGLKAPGAVELLKEHGIRSLIVCGLSTSGAVLRTALGAPDEGFVVTIIQDACGDRAEAVHDTLMRDVLPSRAHVTTTDEFLRAWAAQGNET